MKRVWNSEKLTMHITKYSHSETNDLKSQCKKFVNVSQFKTGFNESLSQNDISNPRWLDVPNCDYGSFLYGLLPNGTLTQVEAIIDSSD